MDEHHKIPGRCPAFKAIGGRCLRALKEGTEFCPRHDPALAERRSNAASIAAKKGVQLQRRRKRRSPAKLALRTSADIASALEHAAGMLFGRRATSGEISQANALARVANAATGTLRVLELERQVNELQKQLEDLGARQ